MAERPLDYLMDASWMPCRFPERLAQRLTENQRQLHTDNQFQRCATSPGGTLRFTVATLVLRLDCAVFRQRRHLRQVPFRRSAPG
jgi:hypothetical protein